jgi:phospholipid transport system substrate-binding protein
MFNRDFTPRSLSGPSAQRLRQRTVVAVLVAATWLWASNAVAAPDPQQAQQLITSTSDHLLKTLHAEGDALRNNPARLRTLADQNLVPHVDFEQVSQLVLGKSWRTATPDQRSRFIREFQQFLVRFYTAALAEYTKGADIPLDVVRFLPLRANSGDTRVTVASRVTQPGGTQPIPVDYRMSFSGGEWKVYDVTVDGVSLVSTYRNSFANEVRKGGMDGLIGRLAQKNAELARK